MAIPKKDRAFILKNHQRMPMAELAKKTGSSPSEVQKVLEQAGIRPSGRESTVLESPSLLGFTRVSLLGMAVLLTVAGFVYLNSFRNGFHYDDIHSLLQNTGVQVEWVKNPASRSLFWRYFVEPELFSSRPQVAMPRPLLMCTFGFNYLVSRYDAWSWMTINILFHLANVGIIYLGLSHLSGRPRFSLLAALIFAVHPINTETVNYINCRSESMAVFFMLLTMYFWSRGVRENRYNFSIISFAFYALGLLTKEMVIVTFGLVFLIDGLFIYKVRNFWDAIKMVFLDHAKYFMPMLGLIALYFIYRNAVLDTLVVERTVRPFSDNLLIQARVAMSYIRLLFFPLHLNISYENATILMDKAMFWSHPFHRMTLPSILANFALIGLVIYWWKKHPVISFCIGLFYVTLSVTFLVPLNALMNEHRLYLPSLTAAILLAALFDRVADWTGRGDKNNAWPIIPQLLAGGLIAVFSLLTIERNFTWYSDHTVWMDSVTKSPEKAQVVSDLGNAFYRGGRQLIEQGEVSADGKIDKAEKIEIHQIFRENLQVGPISPETRAKLDDLYQRGLNRAENLYLWAGRVEYTYYKAWHNLGTINYTYSATDMDKGDVKAAIEHLKKAASFFITAARISPNGESYNDLASTLMQLSNLSRENPEERGKYLEGAEFYYREALKFNPELTKAYINLGMISDQKGMSEKALDYFKQAIAYNPMEPPAYYWQAKVLSKLGRKMEAMSSLKRCLDVAPGFSACRDLMMNLQNPTPNAPAP